jgi:RNA polymerase sigma-70 factor (ECF subfamily)
VTVTVATEFEALFRSEFPRLVSLGVAMTGRRDVAHDLAQETMLRAHRRWDELVTYDSPEAWCRRVMVNLVIDHHRSDRAERIAIDRLSRAETTAAPAPELDRWNDLVGSLPHRQRAIVTLYYADDRSVEEIAELLDTTRGGVKAALFKARRALGKQLHDPRESDDG